MPMPAGFTAPEGAKDGASFDAVATLVLSGDSLVLTELDGIPVASAKPAVEGPEEEVSDDTDFEAMIERGMA